MIRNIITEIIRIIYTKNKLDEIKQDLKNYFLSPTFNIAPLPYKPSKKKKVNDDPSTTREKQIGALATEIQKNIYSLIAICNDTKNRIGKLEKKKGEQIHEKFSITKKKEKTNKRKLLQREIEILQEDLRSNSNVYDYPNYHYHNHYHDSQNLRYDPYSPQCTRKKSFTNGKQSNSNKKS